MLFARKTRELTPRDADDAHVRGRLTLVDVREPAERAEVSIPGSLHIPLGELPARLDELPTGRPAAFVCRSGARSAKAAGTAAKRGIDAASVGGGLIAWEKAALPLDRGAAANGRRGT